MDYIISARRIQRSFPTIVSLWKTAATRPSKTLQLVLRDVLKHQNDLQAEVVFLKLDNERLRAETDSLLRQKTDAQTDAIHLGDECEALDAEAEELKVKVEELQRLVDDLQAVLGRSLDVNVKLWTQVEESAVGAASLYGRQAELEDRVVDLQNALGELSNARRWRRLLKTLMKQG